MLLGLPLEILHLIIFDLWILDHQDIAAVRAVCRELRSAVLPSGLDLEKWQARAGPEWCMKENRPRAVIQCHANESPYDPTANGSEAICWASSRGHLEVVRCLLAAGCDPAANQNEAISNASYNGHLEVVQCLLAAGCDPAGWDNKAIRHAAYNNRTEVITLLLSDERVWNGE
jgi:hypothetical protein